MAHGDELGELSRAGCLRLLRGTTFGRIVFTEAALPAVASVVYLVDGEEVLFLVRRGSSLATATRNVVVGFHADSVDPTTRTGWSVLGIGKAYEITDAGRRAEFTDRAASPPADGTALVVAVPMEQLSGRRLGLCT